MQSSMPRGDYTRDAATAVDAQGAVEVGRGVEAQQLEAPEQRAQILLPFLVTGASKDLHDDGLGDRHRTGCLDQF
jgi:hypothetical protein